jgi:hypothetical protein
MASHNVSCRALLVVICFWHFFATRQTLGWRFVRGFDGEDIPFAAIIGAWSSDNNLTMPAYRASNER